MGTVGEVKLERVWVRCPGCGQQVEAVARDGVIRGWCSISRQRVNFLIEIGKNPAAKIKKRWQDGVVSDYLRGDKISDIQLGYGISPGEMYRVLHRAGVELRTKGKIWLKPRNAAGRG